MERIKLKMPTDFHFSTEINIRITDLNYGGHVGNDSFLALVHEARLQFLRTHGYSEMNMENAGLIMADAAIEFKKELNYGDTVKISVAAAGFDTFGFDLLYKLEVVQGGATVLAGKAKTGMLCYDYENKKLMPLPGNVSTVLCGLKT